jgi:hypothetical protein
VRPPPAAAELGRPGQIVLAWLLAALARLALLGGPGRPERLVIGCGLLTILAHSLFYAAFFEDPMTWGLAALLVVAARPIGTGIMGR